MPGLVKSVSHQPPLLFFNVALSRTTSTLDHTPMHDWHAADGGLCRLVDAGAVEVDCDGGVSLTNAHCQAPICNPSRVSFMTCLDRRGRRVYDEDDV